MNEQNQRDSIMSMARGAFEERVDYEMDKVIQNILDPNTTAGGIGFCGLLAVAFIVLKLTGVINWSWLWVLAPIWIPTAITIAIIVIVLVAILVRELTKGGRP